jgi:hypothetical protein
MPRREGDVFLLGTAMSVSSRGFAGASSVGERLSVFDASGDADKAALIEDGVLQS